METTRPLTITPDPAADAQANRRRRPDTVENLPVSIAAYPRAAAWLAQGCPQSRRRVYRQPAERSSAVSSPQASGDERSSSVRCSAAAEQRPEA